MEKELRTGTVKFFKADSGYGFIIDDTDGKDYFVHFKNCLDRIEGGYKVAYFLINSKKGVMADSVKIIR